MAATKKKRKKRERSSPRFSTIYRRKRIERTDPTFLHLVQCEITYEPMPDPQIEALPRADRERFREIMQLVHDRCVADLVGELEQFREKYPDVPKIHNHLMIAYQSAGRREDAQQSIEDTYWRFPNYLFGLCSYCDLRMTQGRIEEVAALLGRRLHVKLMYPHRNCFHVSEFLCFTATVAKYLFLKGEPEAARTHHDVMRDVDPDHPMTRHIGQMLEEGYEMSLH